MRRGAGHIHSQEGLQGSGAASWGRPAPRGPKGKKVRWAGAAGATRAGQNGGKARSLSARSVFREQFGVMGFWARGGVVRPSESWPLVPGQGGLGQWGRHGVMVCLLASFVK